jgi:hypothetical protein
VHYRLARFGAALACFDAAVAADPDARQYQAAYREFVHALAPVAAPLLEFGVPASLAAEGAPAYWAAVCKRLRIAEQPDAPRHLGLTQAAGPPRARL